MAHSCNPSYSGDRDWEFCGSKPARANSLWDPILYKPITKWAGGVAQGVGSEFKRQYWKKNKVYLLSSCSVQPHLVLGLGKAAISNLHLVPYPSRAGNLVESLVGCWWQLMWLPPKSLVWHPVCRWTSALWDVPPTLNPILSQHMQVICLGYWRPPAISLNFRRLVTTQCLVWFSFPLLWLTAWDTKKEKRFLLAQAVSCLAPLLWASSIGQYMMADTGGDRQRLGSHIPSMVIPLMT
jgi:hypothetical protein